MGVRYRKAEIERPCGRRRWPIAAHLSSISAESGLDPRPGIHPARLAMWQPLLKRGLSQARRALARANWLLAQGPARASRGSRVSSRSSEADGILLSRPRQMGGPAVNKMPLRTHAAAIQMSSTRFSSPARLALVVREAAARVYIAAWDFAVRHAPPLINRPGRGSHRSRRRRDHAPGRRLPARRIRSWAAAAALTDGWSAIWTTREIQGHLMELYGLEVSPDLVAKSGASDGSFVRPPDHSCLSGLRRSRTPLPGPRGRHWPTKCS